MSTSRQELVQLSPEAVAQLRYVLERILQEQWERSSEPPQVAWSTSCVCQPPTGPSPLLFASMGANLGSLLVMSKGFTAVGVLGKGAYLGASAGPVGIALGAVAGLALYGLVRAVTD